MRRQTHFNGAVPTALRQAGCIGVGTERAVSGALGARASPFARASSVRGLGGRRAKAVTASGALIGAAGDPAAAVRFTAQPGDLLERVGLVQYLQPAGLVPERGPRLVVNLRAAVRLVVTEHP